jgi:hypothetical protein
VESLFTIAWNTQSSLPGKPLPDERLWDCSVKAVAFLLRQWVRASNKSGEATRQRSHFVKASGLRWLSVMLLAEVPFAQRVWALPAFTALSPSERYHRERGRRHKRLRSVSMTSGHFG